MAIGLLVSLAAGCTARVALGRWGSGSSTPFGERLPLPFAGLAALAFLRWRCFGWRLLSPPLGALLLTASLRYAFERVSGLQGSHMFWHLLARTW